MLYFMDVNLLVNITSRAWSLTILALMHNGVAGRQAALLAQTGASRTAFAQSLIHLVEHQLLERNPGHGHPMRPEYRLTQTGVHAAQMAHEIQSAMPQDAQNTLLRRSWTVPVLAVSGTPKYFSDIKQELRPITDRALSQSLKSLQTAGWMRREISPEIMPLRAEYAATGPGLDISQAIHTFSVRP